GAERVRHEPDDPVTGCDIGDVVRDGLDGARRLAAQHRRARIGTETHQHVAEVQARRLDTHGDLAGPGLGHRVRDEPYALDSAVRGRLEVVALRARGRQHLAGLTCGAQPGYQQCAVTDRDLGLARG